MANKITFPIFSVYIKSSKELLALSGLLLNPSKPFSHLRTFYFKCGFTKSTYFKWKKFPWKQYNDNVGYPFSFVFFLKFTTYLFKEAIHAIRYIFLKSFKVSSQQ